MSRYYDLNYVSISKEQETNLNIPITSIFSMINPF